jgi:hypothetical protein
VKRLWLQTTGKNYTHFLALGSIKGVAEGFYVFPGDDEDINAYDENTKMIDAHDLIPGELEGNTFPVRDQSIDLLQKINEAIETSGLPWHRP